MVDHQPKSPIVQAKEAARRAHLEWQTQQAYIKAAEKHWKPEEARAQTAQEVEEEEKSGSPAEFFEGDTGEERGQQESYRGRGGKRNVYRS